MSCLSWNPRNIDVLATGSGDGTARMWDFHPDSPTKDKFKSSSSGRALVSRQKPLVMSHKAIDSGRKAVTCMAWHPDGTVLATGKRILPSAAKIFHLNITPTALHPARD
ncbi:hypothetical protein [Citrobacter sp. T1.2D-1]|uniref:hypothetical protein n=1 Tax=Citrobacter sp. T1.2D-1 TaxID=3041164 RepID=UPI00406C7F78